MLIEASIEKSDCLGIFAASFHVGIINIYYSIIFI